MAWSICVYAGMQDAYGTERDILTLYKEQDGEYKANVIEQINHIDPKDVIDKLTQPKHYRTWAGEDQYNYGQQ